MSQHITKYKTENGKTHKVKNPAAKQTDKSGYSGRNTGTETKNTQPEETAKQGDKA
jgi:hypothetical protein